MATASTLNVIGNIWALTLGAEKTVGPLFYIGIGTSCSYVVASGIKVGQIYQARSRAEMHNIAEEVVLDSLLHPPTFTERELQKRQDKVIEMV